MSDAREALVALILERFRAAETYMDLPRQAGLLADAIQSAGWTQRGEGEQPGCTGAGDCPATAHTHGCYADTEGHCERPEEHGWTPPSARCCDPATIETRIDGDWLVDVHQHHTCGTDPDGHYGAHEPGCGAVPVVNLRGLPGWTPPGERVKPTLEQVVDALAAQPPGSAEWTSSRLMQTARAVLALLPGRTETEVKAEVLREAAQFLRGDMDEPWGDRAANRLDTRADRIARGEES